MFDSTLTVAHVLTRQLHISFTFPTRSCCATNARNEVNVGLLKLRASILTYIVVSLYMYLYTYLTASVIVSPQPRCPYIAHPLTDK